MNAQSASSTLYIDLNIKGDAIMRIKHFLTPIILLALLVSTLPRVQAKAENLDDVDKIVTDMMALYDIPGVSLALVKDGKVLYTQGYGKANTATGAGVTQNTVFQIGSITKSMTAVDILQLVEQGKVDLDAPVATYLPDLKLSDPEAIKHITVRQVITQSSGLPRADDGWHSGKLTTRQQVLDDLVNVQVTAAPGKLWQYSNQNFVIAGAIVEKISGLPWEDYTRQHIFEPLGMKSASFNPAGIQAAVDHADPHAFDILKGQHPIPFFQNIAVVGPAGSANANALDMAQYMLFQLGAGDKPLLSKQSIKIMHMSAIEMTGNPEAEATKLFSLATDQGYGTGWMIEKYRGLDLVQHDGAIDGFNANVTLVPGQKAGVFIAANSTATTFLEALRLTLVEYLTGLKSDPSVADVLNLRLRSSDNPILRSFDPVARHAEWDKARNYHANPGDLAKLAGAYALPQGGNVDIEPHDGFLYATLSGSTFQMIPYEPGKFLDNDPEMLGAHFEFKAESADVEVLYLEGSEWARRGGTGISQGVEFKDPKARFSVTIPDGMTVAPRGDFMVAQSTTPKGEIVFGAVDSTGADPKADTKSLLNKLIPTLNADPMQTNPLTLPNGQKWVQTLYPLPNHEFLVLIVFSDAHTLYFISFSGDITAVQGITPQLTAMLASFTTSH